MMMYDPRSIVGVQFYNEYSESFNTKTYFFLANADITYEIVKEIISNRATSGLYEITNEFDYAYKNGKIAIVSLFDYSDSRVDPDVSYRSLKSISCVDWTPAPHKIEISQFDFTYWSNQVTNLIDNKKSKNNEHKTIYTGVNSLEKIQNNNIKSKEGHGKMLNNIMKNFEFGVDHTVKMSVYGPAFRSIDDSYIAFKDDEQIEVTGMTFNVDCLYKMPATIADIKINDYIRHNARYVRVIEKTERGSLICLDPWQKEEITLAPIKSPFGFEFFTKLVNIMGDFMDNDAASKDNPFGSLLPLMIVANSNNDSSTGSANLLPWLMMMNRDKDKKSKHGFDLDPMMMMLLMGGDNKNFNNMLPFIIMNNKNKK